MATAAADCASGSEKDRVATAVPVTTLYVRGEQILTMRSAFSATAGGIDETTHVVAVTGKSVGAVMSQMTLNRANPNFQKFISQVSNIRAIEQNIVTVDLAVFGNVDS